MRTQHLPVIGEQGGTAPRASVGSTISGTEPGIFKSWEQGERLAAIALPRGSALTEMFAATLAVVAAVFIRLKH